MANKTMHHVIIGDDTYEIVDQYAREHGAEIDATLTQSGKAADAKAVGDALKNVSGVPSSVRQAMKTLFEKAAYIETGLADEVAVIQAWASEVTAITISASAISIHGATTSQLSAITTPAGGAVTWESSNTAVATVSNTGLVTGVSNGSAVITARSGDVSATCTATVSGFATLTGIDAVYTQSGTVYTTDSLDSLKDDLVVTGSYDDSSTATITDYALSGTLTEGTSTITVSYGGFTDTFTVTVTETALYPLPDIASTAVSADITVEVTNGNHVKVTTTSNSRGPYIYAESAQAGFYTNRGTLFEVPAGASWETEVTNIRFSGNNDTANNFAVALKPSSSTSLNSTGGITIPTTGDGTLEDVSISGTAESATTIYCMYVFVYRPMTVEFDYCFRVNGTRYI